MAPDASALSNVKPAPAGTRQDGDTESFGFEKGDLAALSTPPKFDDVEEEKRYLKERLALACRIFAQYGLDHHVVRFILFGILRAPGSGHGGDPRRETKGGDGLTLPFSHDRLDT